MKIRPVTNQDSDKIIQLIDSCFREYGDRVSLASAVKSYLFNTQLLREPGSTAFTIIAPSECRDTTEVHNYLQELESSHPAIARVRYFELRESMKNGGGPACLRLRVPLTDNQLATIQPGVLLNDTRIDALEEWVNTHYRDSLLPVDLRDPDIIDNTRRALDELTHILGLGSLYDFQRN